MELESYFLYLTVLAAFFATPPDTSQLLIMSHSLRHGLRKSLATVAGDLTANCLQMAAAACGLTVVIAASANGLTVVKWLGVAYLAWIGLKMMRSSPGKSKADAHTAERRSALYRQGFLTSSANPYAVVFFGALFPQFIDPATALWPQLVILGSTYLLVDGLILVIWGWITIHTFGRIRQLSNVWINRVSGALMMGAAALLASKDLAVETKR